MDERYLDILRAVNYLEEVMGTAWLKESLKSLKGYAGGGGSFGRSIDFLSCDVSAAAYYWYRAREELALDFIGGRGPGLYALQAAVLGDDLWVLRNSQGLSDRIEGLKQPADAGHVIAELAIAAGYVRRGRRVVFATSRVGAFWVTEPKIRVFLDRCGKYPGNGNVKTEKKLYSEGGTEDQQGTAISVIYRYQNKHCIITNCDLSDAKPGRMEWAGDGVLVVKCGFIARQGRRGPEIERNGQLDEGNLPSPDIHIPNEIIMPKRY